jgi:predicted O-methyltransferase YrrM
VYWAMIRAQRPARVVEIGSGFSTLLAAQAVRANGGGSVIAIDPYPREFIRRNDLGIDLRVAAAEQIAPGLLSSLESNDIVFIDSSHVVRRAGDVVWFFLSVLPALRDGVIVHVHDVHFPFDYPRTLILDRNVYWTEQYLLYAYLLKNMSDEVLFASRFSAERFPHECRAAFPDVERLNGASFWMRVHKPA